MFGPMKETLRGRRFSSDEEVICAVQNWLKAQPCNPGAGALKSRGITLKRHSRLVSVYLQ
jgi:hypothetical protein